MATTKTSTSHPRLTKTVVENATPGTVWDRELKGYGVRISPKGVRSYFVHHRLPGGRQVAVTLGHHGSAWTAEQARARAKQLLGAAVCGWLALASAPMVGAGEPIILTPDALDAITAGLAGADVTAISAAIGQSGTLTATSATTSAISGQVSRASGDGGALAVAPGDGLAGTSITNTAGTDSGSSGAWVSTQTSSGAAGDATATSGSRTRAIATPAANIAVGHGYASATGDATSADASTSLYGYGDIVIGQTSQNDPITTPDGSTARTTGVVVAVSPPGLHR